MLNEAQTETAAFPGFPDFQANVTFVPLQFFTVVLPHSSRGCARIVGYVLRKVLGWVDEQGNPTQEQLQVTYRQLVSEAGVSRDAIGAALAEAVEKRFLNCVQPPRADRSGQPGQSGIYELCWDRHGRYTDSPTEFSGFFYPEAALMPVHEAATVVHRPKAARKNIPNAFFDWLLPRERLSVIRVVGALLFYSIKWGPGGERKVPVTLSITELSRLTRFSRQHVHEALTGAAQRGYIQQLDQGNFDTQAGKTSRSATYGIRWVGKQHSLSQPAVIGTLVPQGAVLSPVERGERGQSEKVNQELVGKSEPAQSEEMNGIEAEKMNGIRVKNDLKTETATTALPLDREAAESVAAVASASELLIKAGFGLDTARRLAVKRSLEIIQRQIEWLPFRSTSRNRLGLLRRAIEHDWSKPEGAETSSTAAQNLEWGTAFARSYYAAYHGFSGDAATEPFPKDARMAAKFVERLLALNPNERRISDWAQAFGRLIRNKHQGDAKAKPYLSCALVLYGDEFLRSVQQRAVTRQTEALGKARETHEKSYRLAYLEYLRSSEDALKRKDPRQHDQFLEARRETRHRMTGGVILVSAEMVARFDSEPARLYDFANYFSHHAEHLVLQFWEWDTKLNPRRFGRALAQPPAESHP